MESIFQPTTELSDAGGPVRPHCQLTWPARVRSSDFVRRHQDIMVSGGARSCCNKPTQSQNNFPEHNPSEAFVVSKGVGIDLVLWKTSIQFVDGENQQAALPRAENLEKILIYFFLVSEGSVK